jgi:hypothetical protein
MKRLRRSLASCLLTALVLLFPACGNDTPTLVLPFDGPPSGSLVSYGECNQALTAPAPNDQDCLKYAYSIDGVLWLEHLNAAFNCCPGEITADIDVNNSIITIDEHQAQANCRCDCLYDIDYEIKNLPLGIYTIIVNELYTDEDDEPLEFTVNVAASPTGLYCVPRDHYPWGMP